MYQEVTREGSCSSEQFAVLRKNSKLGLLCGEEDGWGLATKAFHCSLRLGLQKAQSLVLE